MFQLRRQAWAALMDLWRGGHRREDGDAPVGMRIPRARPSGGRSTAIALEEPHEVVQVVAAGRQRH